MCVPHKLRPFVIVWLIAKEFQGGIEFLRELRADRALRPTTVIVLTTSDEERKLTAVSSTRTKSGGR